MDSCSPHLQIVPIIITRLHEDERRFLMWVCRPFLEGWVLQAKLELVASRLWAEPMGDVIIFLILPGVAYQIEGVQKEWCGVGVNVRNGGYAVLFLLQEIYGDMVTDWDISEINSGRIKYALVRTIKK